MKTINKNKQSGQTIIETLAAIFILVTTLTVGLGLAIYTLGNSENAMKEVVATNLARQGIEGIRMMRDSNWLAGDSTNASGFALTNCADINALCFPSVFTGRVNGNPAYANRFDLSTPSQPVCNYSSTNCSRNLMLFEDLVQWAYDPSYNMYQPRNATSNAFYSLWLEQVHNGSFGGFYEAQPQVAGCTDPANCPPDYIRKVKLTRINIAPYTNSNSNWELVVNVYVAWNGRHCAALANQDPETLVTPCKVSLEERLTNWKDYR